MVGVAGLSKGCRTCRRRRVKCDERQPSCARCEKSDFACEGFGRDLSFRSDNSRAKRLSLKQEALRAKAFQAERDSSRDLSIVRYHKNSVSSGSSNVATTPARLWPELNYVAFKDEVQISFTLAHLFSGDTKSIAWLGWGYGTSKHSINSYALKALSGVYYGRLNHQSSFENDGRLQYSKALRGISKAIESRGDMSLDVLLAASTALCYEMIASPTYTGILLHSGGVGKIIELRGPARHCGALELFILSIMRTTICIKAMLDRKRCFLEKEEWKTIPWSRHPEEKTMMARVQDIMCDVPGLFEEFDTLLAADVPTEIYEFRVENLKSSIKYHLKLLSEWRVWWEYIYPSTCHEQPSQFPHSPFQTVLHYQDLEAASCLMLYNALYITISKLGISLLGPHFNYQQLATETESVCTNLPLNAPGASLYDATIEICRSAEYYFSPPYETVGAFFIMFPLKKAFQELPSGSVEQQWLKNMMSIATRNGFLFSAGFL